MSNFIGSLTKRKVLIFSFFSSIVFFLAYFINSFSSCRHEKYCSSGTELVGLYLLPFIAVFIFSLITLKLEEQTFTFWKNFSLWYVPVSLIIISFLPTDAYGLDFVRVTKGTVIFLLTILYSVISLLIVSYQSLKK